jgi:hypothetical protein
MAISEVRELPGLVKVSFVMPPNFINPTDFTGPTIPKWILRRYEITAGAKLLYCHLAQHICTPDFPKCLVARGLHQREIAKSLGASERSVRNWLEELKDAPLITCQVVGWGKPNLYFFLEHPWQKGKD